MKRFLFFPVLMLAIVASVSAQPKVLITYHSQTGNTRGLAEAVAIGAMQVEGVQVVLKTIDETTQADLLEAAAIIVGSPVYNANVAPAVQAFISGWPFEGAPMKDKIGAAFVTAGGISAGEELTQMNILQSMLIFGMIAVGGPDWTAPFGASAIVGEAPFDQTDGLAPQFTQKGQALGQRVAELAVRLNR